MTISIWAQRDWDGFVAAVAGDAEQRGREELQRFVIGMRMRSEPLLSHDLGRLLDATGLDPGARSRLVDDIDFAFSLINAYDRVLAEGGDLDDDDEPEVGLGDLII